MNKGINCFISDSAKIGENVCIGNNVSIHENVVVGDGSKICDGAVISAGCEIGTDVYIDYNVIIRENVKLGKHSFVGAHCILGEYLADFIEEREYKKHNTIIGNDAIIRSETIIYGENSIGDYFQTGHRVTIREKSRIGNNVRVGTLSDIQGDCEIGNYVNMHSNVHIGMKSVIKNFVWIFPYVILTNDPNPPSEQLLGVTIEEYAVIATGTIILPGKTIGKDALVGAGAIVTKDVAEGKVVAGNPIREMGNVADIVNKSTGEQCYPWRYHFDRGMPWKGIGFEEWGK